MANLLDDLQRHVLAESLTPFEKSGGNVTSEDMQATMVDVLRSMKKISLIGNLQRRLDLEYFTPENNCIREVMREASPVMELVIPLFPVLEENRSKVKNKERSRLSQSVLEEIREPELPNPFLFSLNSRGQCRPEIKKYGMPQLDGECSGNGEPTIVDQPLL